MTIQWMEGFDLYPAGTTSNFVGNFWNSLNTAGRRIETTAARNGTRGYNYTFVTSDHNLSRPCVNGSVRTTMGFAMRQNGAYPGSPTQRPAAATFIGSSSKAGVGYNENQRIGVYRDTTLIAESASTFNVGTYNYVEFELYHATTGNVTFNLWVNNQLEATGTMQNINTISAFNIGQRGTSGSVGVSGQSTDFDDIIIYSDIDHLGDTSIILLLPAADETPQDWTPASGVNNYDMIDNVPFNDAEYIETATVSDQSQFSLTTPPADIFAVHALQHQYRAQKDDVQAVQMQGAIILPGAPDTVELGADNVLTQQWNYLADVSETDPDTGVAWTPANLATIELRYERTA